MSLIYNQMWFHVFFGMILYQVASSLIDYYVVDRLEKRRKDRKKV